MDMQRTQWSRRLAALLVLLALAAGVVPSAAAAEGEPLEQAAARAGAWLLEAVPAPQVGQTGGEWTVLGLARSGLEVPEGYWTGYYDALVRYAAEREGVLHTRRYTEYSRVVLALTALGADPADVGGYDLLAPLADFDRVVWQGVNGAIWALIALDSGDYEMPQAPEGAVQATREAYVEEILSRQLAGGGWSMGGREEAEADLTAMALQALVPYRAQEEVAQAVERGVACLAALQGEDGGFTSWGADNAQSAAQVVTALCSLGIDPEDPRFTRDGGTLLDALLACQTTDGGFRYAAGEEEADLQATEQCFYALVAVLRLRRGQPGLYEMRDVTSSVCGGLPEKHPDVARVPVTLPEVSFSDLAGHPNETAVLELARRGILNGRGGGLFVPDAGMTRAEFAAVLVRALGLEGSATDAFSDVAAGDWHAPYIGTACAYGLAGGVGGGRFAPDSGITLEQAAALVARAAGLCGVDTALSAEEVSAVLDRFDDGGQVGDWARETLAFCCASGILEPEGAALQPGRAILRGEVAQMIWNLLGLARLR